MITVAYYKHHSTHYSNYSIFILCLLQECSAGLCSIIIVCDWLLLLFLYEQTTSLLNMVDVWPAVIMSLVCVSAVVLLLVLWITYSNYSKADIAEWYGVVVFNLLTHLPIGSSHATRGRRLIYVFVIFIVLWGIWTARFSLHGWDKTG